MGLLSRRRHVSISMREKSFQSTRRDVTMPNIPRVSIEMKRALCVSIHSMTDTRSQSLSTYHHLVVKSGENRSDSQRDYYYELILQLFA